jgi:hypothetical protein
LNWDLTIFTVIDNRRDWTNKFGGWI